MPRYRRAGRVLLTGSGWGVLLVSVILYLAAWKLGEPDIAVPAVAGFLALGLALWQAAPPRRLEARRDVTPPRVARGDGAQGRLTVVNRGRTMRFGVTATDHCDGLPLRIALPMLRRGEARTGSYPMPTSRRGMVTMGPLLVTRTDVFGLTRRVIECGQPTSMLVRPRVVALEAPPAGRTHHLEGPTSQTAAEGSIAFHSLRDYVFGDDLRHVHWPSTARTGTLVIRTLVDASRPQTTVVLDVRPQAYPDPDTMELAVDCAASVATAAATRNFPVRVLTSSQDELAAGGGRSAAETVLDWLALTAADDRGSLVGVLDRLRRARGGGALVVVTGPRDAAGGRVAAAIETVRGAFEHVVVIRAGVTPGSAAVEASAGDRWRGGEVAQITVHDLGSLRERWERHP